jgi:hypothetical protein
MEEMRKVDSIDFSSGLPGEHLTTYRQQTRSNGPHVTVFHLLTRLIRSRILVKIFSTWRRRIILAKNVHQLRRCRELRAQAARDCGCLRLRVGKVACKKTFHRSMLLLVSRPPDLGRIQRDQYQAAPRLLPQVGSCEDLLQASGSVLAVWCSGRRRRKEVGGRMTLFS